MSQIELILKNSREATKQRFVTSMACFNNHVIEVCHNHDMFLTCHGCGEGAFSPKYNGNGTQIDISNVLFSRTRWQH